MYSQLIKNSVLIARLTSQYFGSNQEALIKSCTNEMIYYPFNVLLLESGEFLIELICNLISSEIVH